MELETLSETEMRSCKWNMKATNFPCFSHWFYICRLYEHLMISIESTMETKVAHVCSFDYNWSKLSVWGYNENPEVTASADGFCNSFLTAIKHFDFSVFGTEKCSSRESPQKPRGKKLCWPPESFVRFFLRIFLWNSSPGRSDSPIQDNRLYTDFWITVQVYQYHAVQVVRS